MTAVAKAIGDLYSGTEIRRLLAAAKLPDPDGEGMTKWKRLYDAVADHQIKHLNGKATAALIVAAMTSARTLDRIPGAAAARDALNQILSLSGLEVGDHGKVHRALEARSSAEAHARATRLRAQLEARGVPTRSLSTAGQSCDEGRPARAVAEPWSVEVGIRTALACSID